MKKSTKLTIVGAILAALSALFIGLGHREAIKENAAEKAASSDAVKTSAAQMPGDALALLERGTYRIEHRDASGRLLWSGTAHNALTNEGQAYMLNCSFVSTTGCVSTFYVRLLNTGANPGLASTLSSKGGTEASGGGYSAASTTFIVSKPATNYQAASASVSWTATGAPWTAVTHLFISTTANDTGKYVAWAALSTSRTLQVGDTLNASYTITQQ